MTQHSNHESDLPEGIEVSPVRSHAPKAHADGQMYQTSNGVNVTNLAPTLPASTSDKDFVQGNKDLSFAAYIIGASVLASAVLVSASMLYIFKSASQRVDSVLSAAQIAAQTFGGQAAAGLAGTAPSQPAAPSQGQAQNPSAAPSGAVVKVALKSNTPYLGSSAAKVTVVEYADYQCPFCEKWYSSVMPDLKSKYISTGKIKFVYQDFAFLGPDSNTASEAAHCAADQNKFWQYHDYLFGHQGQEGSGWATVDHQKQFAQGLGLDTAQFNQCLDSGKENQEVLNETAAGKSYGVSGTPSVIVFKGTDTSIDVGYIQAQLQQQKNVVTLPNGNVFIVGALPLQQFEQAIDAVLKN